MTTQTSAISGDGYTPMMKAGGLRNGAERGHGPTYHAVPNEGGDTRKALCGTAPRIMWSSYLGSAVVTCPRCIKRMGE